MPYVRVRLLPPQPKFSLSTIIFSMGSTFKKLKGSKVSKDSGFWTLKRANIVLAFVGSTWGLNYICMKVVMGEMSPWWMVTLRFSIAFLIVAAVFFKHLRTTNLTVIKGAAVVGFFDAGMFFTLLQGLGNTSVTNAGFICATSVVIVPVLNAIFRRKLPDNRVFICCLIAIVGIGCMTLKESLSISLADIWCLACALSYALWVLTTSHFVKTCDGLQLGIWQLGFAAIYLLIFAAISDPFSLPVTEVGWFCLLLMALLCTAIGFVLQTVAQKYTTPEHASLMFCTEPISSAFFGFILFGEVVGFQGYLGAALILLAVVLSTIKLDRFKLPSET